MNKLFAIYLGLLFIVVAILAPLAFPVLAILAYVEQGFSREFILISILAILTEPLAIGASYALLKSVKDIYNDLLM